MPGEKGNEGIIVLYLFHMCNNPFRFFLGHEGKDGVNGFEGDEGGCGKTINFVQFHSIF